MKMAASSEISDSPARGNASERAPATTARKGAEMADKVVEEIKAAGGDAVANYDSVATREGADGMLWSALSKFGRCDILVNNAGVLRDKSFLNMSDSDWNIVFDVHMKGT